MSYSGHVQYICENGHHLIFDAWEDNTDNCPICNGKLTFRHSVDTTNGSGEFSGLYPTYDKFKEHYDESYEKYKAYFYSDRDANLIEIGFEDHARVDKYGNKYYTDTKLYKPADETIWQKLK